MATRTTQEVFREWACKSADLAAKLYDADPNDRLAMLPILGSAELVEVVMPRQKTGRGSIPLRAERGE